MAGAIRFESGVATFDGFWSGWPSSGASHRILCWYRLTYALRVHIFLGRTDSRGCGRDGRTRAFEERCILMVIDRARPLMSLLDSPELCQCAVAVAGIIAVVVAVGIAIIVRGTGCGGWREMVVGISWNLGRACRGWRLDDLVDGYRRRVSCDAGG